MRLHATAEIGHAGVVMEGTVVRRSVAADVDEWLDVLCAVAAEGRWIATEAPVDVDARRRRFLDDLSTDEAASFVAIIDGRLAGSLGLRLGAGVGTLGMFLDVTGRARGVGTALVGAGVEWARAAGAHKLSLTVFPHNHAARALYSKFGFVTEGTSRRAIRRNNGELWDAHTMGLALTEISPGGPAGLSAPDRGLHRDGLMLRPGRLEDAAPLVRAIDGEVHRWLDIIPDPFTLDDALAFLADVRQGWVAGTGAQFCIIRDGALVGVISLAFDPRFSGLGEVGYWVAAATRGRGVATAAVDAVAEWAFDVVGLRRVELHAAVDNLASRAVAERAGFDREGIKRSWRTIRGVPTDFVLYARLA